MDDSVLIAAAQRGDDKALAQLLHRHYPFVYKYLLKITLSPDLAEEIAQETMLRCIEKIGTYRDKSKFTSWLATIAGRLYADHLRKERRERRWLLRQSAERDAELRAERQAEWRSKLSGSPWKETLRALARLAPEARIAVVMKYYYGYSIAEIAEMTGVPEGTAKSRIHHAIRKLREELSEDER